MGRLLSLLLLASASFAQDTMTPELLWQLQRVGGGLVDPTGQTVLYSVRSYDLTADGSKTAWWVVPLAGGTPRELTEAGSLGDAQWVSTPAGVRLFGIMEREGSDPQVWSCNGSGEDWRQVTDIPGGLANLKVGPSGRYLAFTRDVKMDPMVGDLHADLPKANARVIDGLMYRHWNAWHDFAYTHLHVAPVNDDGKAGPARDIMAGLKVDCPIPPFGGTEQFAWSPDGTTLAWSAKMVKDWARSTDSSVYLTRVNEDFKTVELSVGMPGYDMEPVWSADGQRLAFLSMARPSFESDRNRIMIWEQRSGAIWEATLGLDQTAHSPTWSPDGTAIYFASEHRGTTQIFSVALGDRKVTQVTQAKADHALAGVTPDGKNLILLRQTMIRPVELYVQPTAGGAPRQLTGVNDGLYRSLKVPTVEERWVPATDGKSVHTWIIKPPGFDPSKKYPMITYFQGGPQGQIGQWFSYRWNFHLMAAQGYVVVAPNRRGLPGFGQAWNDQISGDWGGQAMQDILSVHDALAAEPFIDAQRCAGVGASYGGYTAYWMMGNAKDRFSAMISHCGVFNLESMYGSTEELFFVNWDLGGPYWKSPEAKEKYSRFSPHRYVDQWKTPLLVVHGERDYRVPVTQGMEAFTAAQVQGVPSRFLYFPNEGHWVLKPQNGVLWHRVFFDWLGRWCGPKGG